MMDKLAQDFKGVNLGTFICHLFYFSVLQLLSYSLSFL